jgi:hypothetical protein
LSNKKRVLVVPWAIEHSNQCAIWG